MWYQSKKMWVLIVTVVGVLSAAFTGEIQWPVAVQSIVAAAMAYFVGQGIADAKK